MLFESITGMLKGDKGYENFVALKNMFLSPVKADYVHLVGQKQPMNE